MSDLTPNPDDRQMPADWPREEDRRSGLLTKLARDAQADPEQLAVVDRCCDHYEAQGVIQGDVGLPLHTDCPAAANCWKVFGPEHHPPLEEAAVSAPWIGPGYSETRVCAVAINANAYGGLGAQWWIARGAVDDLREGRTGKRYFHLHAGYYVAAVLAALDGHPLAEGDIPSSSSVGEAWNRVSFAEAVKCSPRGNRSKPSDAMWRNCPNRYLEAELEILAPSRLIAIGRPTWEAIKEVSPITGTDYGGHFWRGTGRVAGRNLEVFFVNHPSYGNWRHTLPELTASLRART